MKSAIRKLFLRRSARCVICGKFNLCQHQDDELRGDICEPCLPFLQFAEFILRGLGFEFATEWDEK